MSVLGLRTDAQSDERLEKRALALLTAFTTALPSALDGQLHAAFTWFGRPIAPASLDAARLARFAASAPYRPMRARSIPHGITRAWRNSDVVPAGTRALVLVDLVPASGPAVTVAVSFAGADADARLLAVFDAAALVPHLRQLAGRA